ncbi:hypothetical protein GCM10009639_03430 [Kitasatospora putterlickiae]|uniref:Secreted protein n=1 Tax=Kitasatospora putterlickiae TaxID=221725 RepID=A0ABP4IAR7_9ACTN
MQPVPPSWAAWWGWWCAVSGTGEGPDWITEGSDRFRMALCRDGERAERRPPLGRGALGEGFRSGGRSCAQGDFGFPAGHRDMSGSS